MHWSGLMSPQAVDGFNGIDGIGWESVCLLLLHF
jgi:hypothetical protein